MTGARLRVAREMLEEARAREARWRRELIGAGEEISRARAALLDILNPGWRALDEEERAALVGGDLSDGIREVGSQLVRARAAQDPPRREMNCADPVPHVPHDWPRVQCPGVGGGGPVLPVHLRGDTDETACGIHLADAGPSLALAASIADVTCPICRGRVEASHDGTDPATRRRPGTFDPSARGS